MSRRAMKRVAAVIGVGHTDYVADWARVRAGERPTDGVGYAALAFNAALKDSGIKRTDIDGLISGPWTPYERMGELLGLDVRWGDQGDAVMAVTKACMAIHAGAADVVALVYGNDQRSAGTQYGGPQAMGGDAFLSYVYHAPWGLTSQGSLYAMMFRRYCHERGFTERDLGRVAVAERKGATLNPNAIMGGKGPITLDDYMSSPYICEPLHLFDYCLINDGGVALIIAAADIAEKMCPKPVYIESIGRYDLNQNATALEPRIYDLYLPAQQKAAADLFGTAGIGPEDIDMLQVYDSFSVHIPFALEGYGYCPVGDAGKFMAEEGIELGGRLPVNTSGGHLSESYMQGWNHQVECVRQLRGECGKRQVENCRFVHYSSDICAKATNIIYSL